MMNDTTPTAQDVVQHRPAEEREVVPSSCSSLTSELHVTVNDKPQENCKEKLFHCYVVLRDEGQDVVLMDCWKGLSEDPCTSSDDDEHPYNKEDHPEVVPSTTQSTRSDSTVSQILPLLNSGVEKLVSGEVNSNGATVLSELDNAASMSVCEERVKDALSLQESDVDPTASGNEGDEASNSVDNARVQPLSNLNSSSFESSSSFSNSQSSQYKTNDSEVVVDHNLKVVNKHSSQELYLFRDIRFSISSVSPQKNVEGSERNASLPPLTVGKPECSSGRSLGVTSVFTTSGTSTPRCAGVSLPSDVSRANPFIIIEDDRPSSRGDVVDSEKVITISSDDDDDVVCLDAQDNRVLSAASADVIEVIECGSQMVTEPPNSTLPRRESRKPVQKEEGDDDVLNDSCILLEDDTESSPVKTAEEEAQKVCLESSESSLEGQKLSVEKLSVMDSSGRHQCPPEKTLMPQKCFSMTLTRDQLTGNDTVIDETLLTDTDLDTSKYPMIVEDPVLARLSVPVKDTMTVMSDRNSSVYTNDTLLASSGNTDITLSNGNISKSNTVYSASERVQERTDDSLLQNWELVRVLKPSSSGQNLVKRQVDWHPTTPPAKRLKNTSLHIHPSPDSTVPDGVLTNGSECSNTSSPSYSFSQKPAAAGEISGHSRLKTDFVIHVLEEIMKVRWILGSLKDGINYLLEQSSRLVLNGKDPQELFLMKENMMALKLVSEKLSSHIRKKTVVSEFAVTCQATLGKINQLVQEVNKMQLKKKYLGLDIESVARATFSSSESQVKSFIKHILKYEGNREATVEELTRIYNAVRKKHAETNNNMSESDTSNSSCTSKSTKFLVPGDDSMDTGVQTSHEKSLSVENQNSSPLATLLSIFPRPVPSSAKDDQIDTSKSTHSHKANNKCNASNRTQSSEKFCDSPHSPTDLSGSPSLQEGWGDSDGHLHNGIPSFVSSPATPPRALRTDNTRSLSYSAGSRQSRKDDRPSKSASRQIREMGGPYREESKRRESEGQYDNVGKQTAKEDGYNIRKGEVQSKKDALNFSPRCNQSSHLGRPTNELLASNPPNILRLRDAGEHFSSLSDEGTLDRRELVYQESSGQKHSVSDRQGTDNRSLVYQPVHSVGEFSATTLVCGHRVSEQQCVEKTPEYELATCDKRTNVTDKRNRLRSSELRSSQTLPIMESGQQLTAIEDPVSLSCDSQRVSEQRRCPPPVFQRLDQNVQNVKNSCEVFMTSMKGPSQPQPLHSENSADTGPGASGLQDLELEDVKALLLNFSKLSSTEKQVLRDYVNKLRHTSPTVYQELLNISKTESKL